MEISQSDKIKKLISKNNKKLIWVIILIILSVGIGYLTSQIPNIIKKETVGMLEVVENGLYDGKVYTNEYAKLDVALLTDCIATCETDSGIEEYYVVYDEAGYMYIVELSKTSFYDLEQINKYTYGELEEAPEIAYVTGITESIPEELRKIIIDAYNKGEEEAFLTEENFESYFGAVLLDTTKGPYDTYEGLGISAIIIVALIALIIFIDYIVKKSKTNKTIKRLQKVGELDDVYSQLDASDAISFEKIKLVLTRNYIVDCTDGFGVYKYDDIKWFYLYRHRVNFAEAERAIIIRTKNNKQYSIAKIAPSKVKNEKQEKIFNELANRCKDVLIGFTKENQKEYKEFIKNNK